MIAFSGFFIYITMTKHQYQSKSTGTTYVAHVSHPVYGVYPVDLYLKDKLVWSGRIDGVKTSSYAASRAINAYVKGGKP